MAIQTHLQPSRQSEPWILHKEHQEKAIQIFLSPSWGVLFPRHWVLQFSSVTQSQASLSSTNSWSLLKLMSIESVMPSNHLILCHSLLLLTSIFPSIKVFTSESVLRMRWPEYWSFSFSISPSKEYSGLIFFRIDWLDVLAVQGTLKSLLQHHSSKASILQHLLSLQSNSHIYT